MSIADGNIRRYEEARARQKAERRADQVPPTSLEAEQGVLGCVLLDAGVLERALAKAGGEKVFYDIRHQIIFDRMAELWVEKKATAGAPMGLIMLQQRLQDHGELEQVGGMVYLASLGDVAPSALEFDNFFGILWEKFLGRKLLTLTSETQGEVFERNGVAESTLVAVARKFELFQELTTRGNKIAPKELKRPGEFAEGYFKLWFRDPKIVTGWPLPFNFVWHGRKHEMTLMTGDSGSGKSSFIGHMCVEWMMREVPLCVASMEVPADVTLWIMSRQLTAAREGHMERSEENERKLVKPLGWLNSRMLIYDFLGITNWRTLLDVFHYAADEGCEAFFLDSVMRIGIPEDDLAQQAIAAAEFANFAVKRGVHLLCVNHVNKGEGSAKRRVSGSKKWTDNTSNLVEVERNEKKGNALAELEASKGKRDFNEDEYKAGRQKWVDQWDSRFVLHKQRFPGAPQNGAKFLYFDHGSLQFRDKYEDGPVEYLKV